MNDSNERKFLHDIASPLGAAIFLLDMTVEDMVKRTGANPEEQIRSSRPYSLKQIQALLEASAMH